MSEPVEQEELEQEDDVCPVCKGVDVLHQGRCTTCMECGWSKCDI